MKTDNKSLINNLAILHTKELTKELTVFNIFSNTYIVLLLHIVLYKCLGAL